MIVVADTSPLNYFVQIGCESILSPLYQRVLIPHSVLEELGHSDAPKAVADWLSDLPRWVDVRRTTGLPIWTLENVKQFSSRKSSERICC